MTTEARGKAENLEQDCPTCWVLRTSNIRALSLRRMITLVNIHSCTETAGASPVQSRVSSTTNCGMTCSCTSDGLRTSSTTLDGCG
jgi:hypothetical protein